MEHQIAIIDYTEQKDSVYMDVEVFDAAKNKRFRAELRFLGDLLYGDLIHAERSPLTEECRMQTEAYIRKYFNR